MSSIYSTEAFSNSWNLFSGSLANPNRNAAKLLYATGGSGAQAASDFLRQTNNLRSVNPASFEQFLRGSISGFGVDAREAAQDGYIPNDPLLSYQWAAYIPGVIDRHEYIMAITTPSIRYDQQPRFISGKVHHYAGFMSVDDVSMTIYTEVSGMAPSTMAHWVREIRSRDGLYNLPSQYKKTIVVVLLDQADRIVAEFRYEGAWPSSWSSYNLQFGQASYLVTETTLSVDDVSFAVVGLDEFN